MTQKQKREILVVGSTTIIGLSANIFTYSLKIPTTKENALGFKFILPKGIELTYVLITGVVAGIIVNKVLSYIEDSVKTKEEKLLDEQYYSNIEKAKEGIVKDKNPSINWI